MPKNLESQNFTKSYLWAYEQIPHFALPIGIYLLNTNVSSYIFYMFFKQLRNARSIGQPYSYQSIILPNVKEMAPIVANLYQVFKSACVHYEAANSRFMRLCRLMLRRRWRRRVTQSICVNTSLTRSGVNPSASG